MDDEETRERWYEALVAGDAGTIAELIGAGIDVNAPVKNEAPLQAVVRRGGAEAARLLLDSGAQIDACNVNGMTALMWAVNAGSHPTVKLLLERGADVNLVNSWRGTALMIATAGGFSDIIKLLVDSGTDLNARSDVGYSAFDFAKSRCENDIWDYMRDRGAKPGNARTVLVLGAGFTKGFFETSPLLVDTFGVKEALLPKYSEFPAAKAVIEAELKRQADEDGEDRGRVNLERLMTRLAGGMPYDVGHGAKPILDALLADVHRAFLARIKAARDDDRRVSEFRRLLGYCNDHIVDYITFNYDDRLDEHLEHIERSSKRLRAEWDPDVGYGFYIRPAYSLIGGSHTGYPSVQSATVLKLHGSINWYPMRGATAPFSVKDIVHDSLWVTNGRPSGVHIDSFERRQQIAEHIEGNPFIVPPILTKTDLVEQPILQLLWSKAYDLLRRADQIIFVGYSLPITDIAASQLFSEALPASYPYSPVVRVIDCVTDDERREKIKTAYRRIYPDLPDDRFSFDGALAWSERFVESNCAQLYPVASSAR